MTPTLVTARLGQYQYLIVPCLLLGLLLFVSLLVGPRLMTSEGIAGALIVAVPLILATLALTPVALVGHGVDLSVGPLLGFINVTLVKWLVGNGITDPVVIFAYAIGSGVAWQMLQALLIVGARVPPIIVTLAGYLVLSGVNLEVMDRPSGVAPDWMTAWGHGVDLFSAVSLVLAVALLFWGAITRTGFFHHLRTTGADLRTAFTSGVRTNLVRVGAHVLAGVFVGLAAITYTSLIGSGDPNQGSTYTLSAVTALVLGGTSLAGGRGGGAGSLIGAVNMYLITYVLASFSFGAVSGFVTQTFFGLILVLSLLVNAAFERELSR